MAAPASSRAQSFLAFACYGGLNLLLVAWNWHFSFQLFSDMDGGVLTNAAWQKYCGAVPYRDFLTATPPLFILPAGWAFCLFGVSWSSLSVLVCLFSFLTFTWMFFLLWRTTDVVWVALGISFAVQAFTFITLSWWWYNAVTEVVAALFFASVCGLLMRPPARAVRCSFVLALTLLGLAKANIAGPLIVLGIALLLTFRGLRLFVLVAMLAAAVLDIGFLAAQQISIASLLHNYSDASSGRFAPAMLAYQLVHPGLGSFTRIQTNLIVGLALALLLAVLTRPRWERNRLVSLFAIALLITISGFLTNGDTKTVDIPCLVILIAFVKFPPAPDRLTVSRPALTSCGVLVAFLIAWNGMIGFARWQFYWTGGDYVPPAQWVTLQDPPFFRGMQVSPTTAGELREVALILKERGPTKIFFGPGLDFCYPAFHLPVEPGLPLWWENVPSTPVDKPPPTGSRYAPEAFRYPVLPAGQARDPRVQRFADAKFDLCLFQIGIDGKPDMSFFPADLRVEIYDHYTLEYQGKVAILTRK
jgi:hypothetical protein